MPRVFLAVIAVAAVNHGVAFGAANRGAADRSTAHLTSVQIENLALLGKVWGYLKYHHPKVTRGCFDWDKELLGKLPPIVSAPNRQDALDLIETLIRETSDGETNPGCAQDILTEVHLRPRKDWLRDQRLLGNEASALLQANTYTGPFIGSQYYVGRRHGARSPVFENEADYAELGQPDWRYRLLALFRLWNIIEYWFPYRDLISSDWDQVLTDFVPRLYEAGKPEQYVLELMALIARIEDGHANLWSSLRSRPPAGEAWAPFVVRFVENHAYTWRKVPFKTDPDAPKSAASSDEESRSLQVGDVILAIDGTTVERLIEKWSPYYGASNESAKLHYISIYLLRGDVGKVRFKVNRDGTTLDVTSQRVPLDELNSTTAFRHDRDGETFQKLSDEIAYLKLSTIEQHRTSEYIEAAQGAKGLIVDIRGYPASSVVYPLGSHLVTEPTPFARFTHPDLSNPGTFVWAPPMVIGPAEPHYEGRVVILVDEYSQSAAEYTAMALRAAPNAIVLGSRTAGADGDIRYIPLPGGQRTGISSLGIFYPDNTPTQKIGIVPDREVLPTLAGIRAGRDEVLEAAIREILGPEYPQEAIRTMANTQ